MNEWILGCNSKYFDIEKAFDQEQMITWRQEAPVKLGDIIYFYVSNPYQAILYKCEVIKVNLQNMDMNSRQYVLKPQYYDRVESYMLLKLVRAYPEVLFTDKELKKYGVTSFQTVVRVDSRLAHFLHREGRHSMFFLKYFKPIAIAIFGFLLGIGVYVAFGGNKKDTFSEAEIQESSALSISSIIVSDGNMESSIKESDVLVSSSSELDAVISDVESEIGSEAEEIISEIQNNLMENISAVPYSWNPKEGETFHKTTGKNRLRSWNNERYGGLIQLFPNEIYYLSIKSCEEMAYKIGYILFATEDGSDYVEGGLPNNSGWIYIDNNKEKYEFTINTSEKNYYLGINLANKDGSELTENEIECLKEVLKNISLVKEKEE